MLDIVVWSAISFAGLLVLLVLVLGAAQYEDSQIDPTRWRGADAGGNGGL